MGVRARPSSHHATQTITDYLTPLLQTGEASSVLLNRLLIGFQPKTSCCLSSSKHSWEPRCGSVQCIAELRRPRQEGHKFKTRLVT